MVLVAEAGEVFELRGVGKDEGGLGSFGEDEDAERRQVVAGSGVGDRDGRTAPYPLSQATSPPRPPTGGPGEVAVAADDVAVAAVEREAAADAAELRLPGAVLSLRHDVRADPGGDQPVEQVVGAMRRSVVTAGRRGSSRGKVGSVAALRTAGRARR